MFLVGRVATTSEKIKLRIAFACCVHVHVAGCFLVAVAHRLSLQGARGSFGKSDRAVLSSIHHLVELERRSLEEVHLNEQADWSLNVRPRLRHKTIISYLDFVIFRGNIYMTRSDQ